MSVDQVLIKKVSLVDFLSVSKPLKVCGILITIISKKGTDYTFIQMSEPELKQTSALNVFHIFNKAYYSHIIMKVLELKRYEFGGIPVSIEEVPDPDYLVDVGTVKYRLNLSS